MPKTTFEFNDPHYFLKNVKERTTRTNMNWYHNNLLKVLNRAKENHARDMDGAIHLGKELVKILEEKRPLPIEVPLREVEPSQNDSLMKPIEPEVLKILTDSTEKGGDVAYLKQRNKKSPEEKFFYRVVSSWDYGWQQKLARVPPRSENHGRCGILRDTFYRKNNIGPDPIHYAQPAGGHFSICSEYSCINN
ncbi:hypothetical protein O0L34_g7600 [Tuta absoluta]|nr:hypothetical protein O0L34_g7600 [Tuta absoluta]